MTTAANGALADISGETMKLLADFPNMWDQLQKSLDSKQAKNDDTVRNIEEQFKKIQDALEPLPGKADLAAKRIADLELQIAKKGGGSKADPRDDDLYKEWASFIRKGSDAVNVAELKKQLLAKSTIRTDIDTQGGFLTHPVLDGEIRKNITEFSPVRRFARVRPMPGKSLSVTRRGTNMGANGAPFEGETESAESGTSKYVQENITAHRQSWKVPITHDQLLMSAFDVETELMSDVTEHFMLGESRRFVNGVGDKGPKGFMVDTRCEVVQTASTGVIAFEDLASIIGKMKWGQNPAFFMNRTTLTELWKLKGSDGHPIWSPISAGGQMNPTIFGYPYTASMIHMDTHVPTTSNTKPLAFADLQRGYEIFDLAQTFMIRDDYTLAGDATVNFIFHRYLTGQVILPEAIKIMQVK